MSTHKPIEIDDLQLEKTVFRTREGDVAAFEVVVRRFETSLRAWLAGHVPPGIDVDGLFIQDALDNKHNVDPVFIAGLPSFQEVQDTQP